MVRKESEDYCSALESIEEFEKNHPVNKCIAAIPGEELVVPHELVSGDFRAKNDDNVEKGYSPLPGLSLEPEDLGVNDDNDNTGDKPLSCKPSSEAEDVKIKNNNDYKRVWVAIGADSSLVSLKIYNVVIGCTAWAPDQLLLDRCHVHVERAGKTEIWGWILIGK